MSSFPTTGRETTSPRTETRTSPPGRADRVRVVARWCLQVLFGLILIASAVGKVLDVPGFVEVIGTYQLIPPALGWPVAIGVIAVEGVLAIWLFSNRRLVPAGIACTVVHFGYMSLAVITLLRGIELDNCGCFGVFLARPLGIHTVVEDGVLTALSIVLFVLAHATRVKK